MLYQNLTAFLCWQRLFYGRFLVVVVCLHARERIRIFHTQKNQALSGRRGFIYVFICGIYCSLNRFCM